MNNEINVECVFTGDNLPHYGKDGDSAMDIYAYTFQEVSKGEMLPIQEFGEDGYILQPHDRILVQSGLVINFPEGVGANMKPRSGLSLKHGIMAILGTIDNKYRGDNGVILLNTSNEPYIIKKGDRLGQIEFTKPIMVNLIPQDKIAEGSRGTDAFGSTGK